MSEHALNRENALRYVPMCSKNLVLHVSFSLRFSYLQPYYTGCRKAFYHGELLFRRPSNKQQELILPNKSILKLVRSFTVPYSAAPAFIYIIISRLISYFVNYGDVMWHYTNNWSLQYASTFWDKYLISWASGFIVFKDMWRVVLSINTRKCSWKSAICDGF